MNDSEEEALLRSDDEDSDYNEREMNKSKVKAAHHDSNKRSPDDDIDDIDINNDQDDEDDDDDDNDGDDDIQKLNEFEALLKELDCDKYAYDKYVRLCELSHATDDLDNIRKAYTKFSEVYPLTPELWQRFISVELNISQSPKELEMIETLFRKALEDYYSCNVAKQFALTAIRLKDSLAIWNEIISVYGLHCMRGNEFFQQYREYLNHEEKLGKDIKSLYIDSFVRQLQCPLHEMEETFIEFKVFYEKNKDQLASIIKWDNIEMKYYKAKEQLQKMLPYEEHINSLNEKAFGEKAAIYFDYIKAAEEIDVDFNIIQILYERMVADCCLNEECWSRYINFMDEHKKKSSDVNNEEVAAIFKQNALDITKRALRNCSWSSELYIKRMHLLEIMEQPKEVVQECLEMALSAGFQTPEPVVQIWLAYLTYLRRHTNWQDSDECEVLRKNFNLSWNVLGQQWGVLADCNCEILQFWGRLEYGPLRDAKRGKELWTTVMESSDNDTKSALWIEFIQMEMRYDLDYTRKLFRKALRVRDLDNRLAICSAWERFERCNGTIRTLEYCLEECSTVRQQMIPSQGTAKVKENEPKKVNKKFGKGKNSNSESNLKRKSSPTPSSSTNNSKKLRKISDRSNMDDDHSTDSVSSAPTVAHLAPPTAQPKQNSATVKSHSYRDHENQVIDEQTDRLRIFLSNLDYNITEAEIRQGLSDLKIINLELIRSANGRSRGFGYAQLENENEVEKALAMDRVILCGRPLFISSVLRDKQQRQKFKYSVDIEPKKLFVKSLPIDVTQKELEELFGTFGKLNDVRLVYHKSGKFKNIAYIEYENENDAQKALAANQTDLRGHIISVAISAPPPKAAVPTPAKLLMNSLKLPMKPKMSLIPSVVRKNFANNLKSMGSNVEQKVQPQESLHQQNGSQMTNDDFRKLLKPS